MIDRYAGMRGTLGNFVAWLKQTGTDIEPMEGEVLDGALNAFCATQVAGPQFLPSCTHCGSSDVHEGDFATKPSFNPKTKAYDSPPGDSAGPAWVCNACGYYTPREVE